MCPFKALNAIKSAEDLKKDSRYRRSGIQQSLIQLCWFAPLGCNILSQVYGGSCLSERKTKSASLSLLLSILTTDKTHLLQGIEIEGPVLFWQFFQESHQSDWLLCRTKRPFLYWIQHGLLKIDKIQILKPLIYREVDIISVLWWKVSKHHRIEWPGHFLNTCRFQR